jgi:hypothetical protein
LAVELIRFASQAATKLNATMSSGRGFTRDETRLVAPLKSERRAACDEFVYF